MLRHIEAWETRTKPDNSTKVDASQIPYLLALTKVKGVGAQKAKILVSYSGGFEAVFRQSKKELSAMPGISDHVINNILQTEALSIAEKELDFLEKNSDIHILPYTSDDYPQRFRLYEDCPLFLYFRGNLDSLQAPRTVGIVGTRDCTRLGVDICHSIVSELAPFGVTVISGLAYGIDTAAHQKSVDLDVPTIGILGHGLDQIYPAANRKLADKMLGSGGLISEFPPGSRAAREHFPMRNRLVAAISDALIVVESAKKGGSMITASLANGYHKDVFAVPGRISDGKSEGCNLLIKSHQANLYQSGEDIAYIMNWKKGEDKPKQMEIPLALTVDEESIIKIIKELESASPDQLSYRLEMNQSKISSLLLNLEFKGIVRSLPGKKYTLAYRY